MVLSAQRVRDVCRGDVESRRRLDRTGYRLPTEAEWEYAARAGTVTSRYYGQSNELLEYYACYQASSSDRASPCGNLLPNDLGMFDLLGNAYEWTHDRSGAFRPGEKGVFRDVTTINEIVFDKTMRVFRGAAFDVSASEVRAAHRVGALPNLRELRLRIEDRPDPQVKECCWAGYDEAAGRTADVTLGGLAIDRTGDRSDWGAVRTVLGGLCLIGLA